MQIQKRPFKHHFMVINQKYFSLLIFLVFEDFLPIEEIRKSMLIIIVFIFEILSRNIAQEKNDKH